MPWDVYRFRKLANADASVFEQLLDFVLELAHSWIAAPSENTYPQVKSSLRTMIDCVSKSAKNYQGT